LCLLTLEQLEIFYSYSLDPLVSVCAIDRPKSIRFPYESLCCLGYFMPLARVIIVSVVSLPTLFVSERAHGNMATE
jgi:hypothetical protein